MVIDIDIHFISTAALGAHLVREAPAVIPNVIRAAELESTNPVRQFEYLQVSNCVH